MLSHVSGSCLWPELCSEVFERDQAVYERGLRVRFEPPPTDAGVGRCLKGDQWFAGAARPKGPKDPAARRPRWQCRLVVDDVAAAIAKAVSLGAKVTQKLTQHQSLGVVAELKDAAGTPFPLIAPAASPSSRAWGGDGEFFWATVSSPKPDVTRDFVANWLGVQVFDRCASGLPTRDLLNTIVADPAGRPLFEILRHTSSVKVFPPSWVPMLRVTSLEQLLSQSGATTAWRFPNGAYGPRAVTALVESPGGLQLSVVENPELFAEAKGQ